jgi:hypothetical protein
VNILNIKVDLVVLKYIHSPIKVIVSFVKSEIKNNMSVLDWLKEQLEGYGDPFKCEIEWTELDELFEQAKEKEKESSFISNEK